MSEKIVFTPGKIAPAAAKPGAAPAGNATHSRSFAEMLAEAEAVQDVVEVRRAAAAAGAIPGPPGSGVLQGALHGVAEMLMRPLPRLGWSARPVRERRKPQES